MNEAWKRAVAAGVLLAAACCAPAGAQSSAEPQDPGRGGLPGITGTALDAEPNPPGPDRDVPPVEAPMDAKDPMDDTTQRDPEASTGTPGARLEKKPVTTRDITRVREAVTAGAPAGGMQDLRVFNRDGKAYVTGVVGTEAERDEVARRVYELVGAENAVIEVEVRTEGESPGRGETTP